MARKTETGRWRGEYRDGTPQHRRHSKVFDRERDAKDWENSQKLRVRRGRLRDPKAARQTLRDFVEAPETGWWATRVAEESTLATDRSRIDKHVLARFGDWPIEDISYSAVQGWVKALQKGGLSGATVHSCHQLLASMLESARRDGLIPDNPARGVALPTPNPGTEVYLTQAEVDEIAADIELPDRCWRHIGLAVAPSCRACPLVRAAKRRSDPDFDRAVLYTLAYTGARWGEIAGLHTGQLNLLRGEVKIHKVLTEVGGRRIVREYPKGKKRRTVPLTDELVEILARHLHDHPAGRDELVFRPANRVGVLSRHTWPRDRFKPAVRRALDRDDVREHDLRHSYASWLLQGGLDIAEVSVLLGHSSIVVTQRYSHLKVGAYDRPLEVLQRPRASRMRQDRQ